MSRIHPDQVQNRETDLPRVKNAKNINHTSNICECPSTRQSKNVLTVWKRSSMTFQGTDGFTVFDSAGKLAFRVDNYTRKHPSLIGGGGGVDLLLMDGSGKALLSLKPQILSIHQQWNGYRVEEEREGQELRSKSREFTMRRGPRGKDCEAEVFMGGSRSNSKKKTPDFTVEGSFGRRNCKIKSVSSGEVVAKISRKAVNTMVLLSEDVFSLVVQPGFDTEIVMAFIVVLDRICPKPFVPLLCSFN